MRATLSPWQINVFIASWMLLRRVSETYIMPLQQILLPHKTALAQLIAHILQQVSLSEILHGTPTYKINESKTILMKGTKVRPPPPHLRGLWAQQRPNKSSIVHIWKTNTESSTFNLALNQVICLQLCTQTLPVYLHLRLTTHLQGLPAIPKDATSQISHTYHNLRTLLIWEGNLKCVGCSW